MPKHQNFCQKTIYATNKTDVYHIDDVWSLDILDLKDYGPENNRNSRYDLVLIDNISKFGWTIPLKKQKSSNNHRFFREYSYNFDKKTRFNRN